MKDFYIYHEKTKHQTHAKLFAPVLQSMSYSCGGKAKVRESKR